MVARSGKILRQIAKHGLAIVMNFARLAVHHVFCSDYSPSERRADCLMSEAHTENRNFPGKTLNQRNADASFSWRARSR